MAKLELTDEYLREEGDWISSANTKWKQIHEEVLDYDEGRLTKSYVWQSIESGRYYSFVYCTNSWDDYSSDADYNEDGYQIEEVEPVEVTVIQYKAKK